MATIEAMGAHGHGVARIGQSTVHIPYTLPGEIVRIRSRGDIVGAVAIESASPERIRPICKHFGRCGSCSLQHWHGANYQEWKVALVRSALARGGVAASVEGMKSYPVSSRRRAAFTVRKAAGGIELGYHAERSHDAIDLEECPVLLPEIASALPRLKAALNAVLPARSEAKLQVTAAANGLDCTINGPNLPAVSHQQLIHAFSGARIIRAFWNSDIILVDAVPYVVLGDVRVTLSPGVFLQAVEACQRDMTDFVLKALGEANAANGPVCDLFAGLGAFTFPVAKFAAVTAYEESAPAVAALAAAARRANGLKPVTAIRRDLFRYPLGPVELNKFGAIIADPPREGAEAQCRALASSKAGTAVMLSCNPTTFARDAAILSAGGLSLARLAVFDQFRFSAHVEIAAIFQRPGQ
jgi:23S rRNA (uracil1939-C5)-methyltransferase